MTFEMFGRRGPPKEYLTENQLWLLLVPPIKFFLIQLRKGKTFIKDELAVDEDAKKARGITCSVIREGLSK